MFELAASIIDAFSGMICALEEDSAEFIDENKLVELWVTWAKVTIVEYDMPS